MIKNRFVAHIVTLFCFPFIGLIASFAYLFYFHRVLGIQSEGYSISEVGVAFPMYSIPLFAFWLVAWEILRALRKGPITISITIGLSICVTLLFGFMVTGTSGFMTHGRTNSFNYFFVGIGFVGSMLHYLLVPKTRSNPTG